MTSFSNKTVFIVPYRDRLEHLYFFQQYLPFVLPDINNNNDNNNNNTNIDYEVYFAHQKDTRPFNRGAMKNIGFLAIKNKYPNHYKKFTFIFNDVDVLPYTKNIFDYKTADNIINHYYGYTNCLGGSFAIKGKDFERINGFPNLWSYGFEDTIIQTRALSVLDKSIRIERDNFYEIGNKKVLQLFDGLNRLISKNPTNILFENHKNDGISSIINNNNIRNLKYNIVSETPCQDKHSMVDFFMIDVENFTTDVKTEPNSLYIESIMNLSEQKKGTRRQGNIRRVGLM
tara:strand:- start:130 stop:987 length:858 start_codon:yes stop_codon:yes gene_type:complete